jgi:rhodanese-related sulfurtransferase
LIIMCSQSHASSLAAASRQDLGLHRATDRAGDFIAWAHAGLPVLAG